MGCMTNGLSFRTLREANLRRLPSFNLGDDHLSSWTPAQWFQALAGEVGEYASWRKRFERGDLNEEEFLSHARKELADVMIYLDLLAARLGIELGDAVREKFNEVSLRIGSPIAIGDDGDWHLAGRLRPPVR